MNLRRSIYHPLRRLAQAEAGQRALAIEAAICLALARLGLAVLTFPKLASYFGNPVSPPATKQFRSPVPDQERQAVEDVGLAVTRATRYLPFRALCLPQAMAARMMLKRRGIPSLLHFGATIEQGRSIAAHAWLDAAGIEVTGYPVPQGFAEIACFE